MKSWDNVSWSHQAGEKGPENWKHLCDEFSACGGKTQSPINIITNKTKKCNKLTALKVNYSFSKVDIVNDEHMLRFNIFGNNTLMIGNKEYKLLQFHYHAKSEHTIDGKHFPIEVHFVHKYSDVDFAVLSIFFNEGKGNKLFADYLTQFPINKGEYVSEKTIDLKELFPSDLSYYYYKGSLTTPPCSEVVNWYVLKFPLKASKEQIDKISKILHSNFRPVMPLNDREILSFDE